MKSLLICLSLFLLAGCAQQDHQRIGDLVVRVLALVGFLVLPLLALSAALLWLAENAWAHFANCRSKRA